MPYVDAKAAELLFRHQVIAFLRDEELLSQERIELLLWWQNTGFSVHNTLTVGADDAAGTERLARYLLRPPLSLAGRASSGWPWTPMAPFSTGARPGVDSVALRAPLTRWTSSPAC